jgi:hypothetical protein
MAIKFQGNHQNTTETLFTGYPFSVSMQFRCAIDWAATTMFAQSEFANASTARNVLRVFVQGPPPNRFFRLIIADSSGSRTYSGTTEIVQNVWYHVLVVYVSSGYRIAYLNGVQEILSTQSFPIGFVDCSCIGGHVFNSGSVDTNWNGDIGEVGVWDADMRPYATALGKGAAPSMFPRNLKFYDPMALNLPRNLAGSLVHTQSGSPAKAEAWRVIRPSAQILRFPSAALGPTITSIDPAPPLIVGQTGVKLVGSGFGT